MKKRIRNWLLRKMGVTPTLEEAEKIIGWILTSPNRFELVDFKERVLFESTSNKLRDLIN